MYCSWLVFRPGLVEFVTSGAGGLLAVGGAGVAEVTVAMAGNWGWEGVGGRGALS